MKIVFDLTPIYDHLTGIERYNINITKEMIKHHPEDEYVLIFKNEIHEEFKQVVRRNNINTIILPECNKLLFIQWRLYKALREVKADYFMFLSFTGPILLKKDGLLNAIHDLTCIDCPETIPTKMKYYYRWTNKAAIRKSWKVITVSEFSKKRICEEYKIAGDQVPVVYDGLTDIFKDDSCRHNEVREKYSLPEKYILSLSTIEPRKNLQLLISAYIDLCNKDSTLPDLVLAGREGWKLDNISGSIAESVKAHIHFTGFIEDKDLAQIYREAELFVFPSKYEGFGIPVIEAMSQGTLVVCSDAASLPEVALDAGILFKSNDIEALKGKIQYALKLNAEEKKKRISRGKEISSSFSWEKEAEKLYHILLVEN